MSRSRLVVSSVASALAVANMALAGCSRAEPPLENPCSPPAQALAAAALSHVADTRQLPDFNLLSDDNPILVRNQIRGLDCDLPNDVLPGSSQLPLRFASPAQLQTVANAEGRVRYIDMWNVRGLERPEASIRLGVGIRLAEGDDRGLLCCCSATATFRNTDGSWVFAGWTGSRCA